MICVFSVKEETLKTGLFWGFFLHERKTVEYTKEKIVFYFTLLKWKEKVFEDLDQG